MRNRARLPTRKTGRATGHMRFWLGGPTGRKVARTLRTSITVHMTAVCSIVICVYIASRNNLSVTPSLLRRSHGCPQFVQLAGSLVVTLTFLDDCGRAPDRSRRAQTRRARRNMRAAARRRLISGSSSPPTQRRPPAFFLCTPAHARFAVLVAAQSGRPVPRACGWPGGPNQEPFASSSRLAHQRRDAERVARAANCALYSARRAG
jgi:hypothetical protein